MGGQHPVNDLNHFNPFDDFYMQMLQMKAETDKLRQETKAMLKENEAPKPEWTLAGMLGTIGAAMLGVIGYGLKK